MCHQLDSFWAKTFIRNENLLLLNCQFTSQNPPGAEHNNTKAFTTEMTQTPARDLNQNIS